MLRVPDPNFHLNHNEANECLNALQCYLHNNQEVLPVARKDYIKTLSRKLLDHIEVLELTR